MRDLPEDITFNILTRVPAKTAGLCRCVSKEWRTMLSQPDFIKTHIQISKINSPESLLIRGIPIQNFRPRFFSGPLTDSDDKITLPLTMLDLTKQLDLDYRYFGSCNGLLLFEAYTREMIVINPLTRVIRKLPPPPFERFHSHSRESVVGFGYHPVEDDYKIVIFSYEFPLNYTNIRRTFVDILSLKSGDWKRLESSHCIDSPPTSRLEISFKGVFVGGCLHWLHNNAVVAFDLVDEMLREIQPPSLILQVSLYELGLVGGSLCIYSIINNEAWVMKEYGVPLSWTKFIINFPRHPMFMCFFVNFQEKFVAGCRSKNEYAMWDLKDGTSKEVIIKGFDDNKYSMVEASFFESLVSPYLG